MKKMLMDGEREDFCCLTCSLAELKMEIRRLNKLKVKGVGKRIGFLEGVMLMRVVAAS